MEILLSNILDFGFKRTKLPLRNKDFIVVHAVAGAGKSTLIRKILENLPEAQAYTHGAEDPQTLSGRRIKSYSERPSTPGPLDIVDEYLGGDFTGAKVIFCDPYQYLEIAQEAHFVQNSSKRFGRNTAKLLRTLEFDVESEREDVLLTTDIWQEEIQGTIIAYEPEVLSWVTAHGAKCLNPAEIRGRTFQETTVVCTDLQLCCQELRHLLYVSLTRHRTKLIIASQEHKKLIGLAAPRPNALDTTPRPEQDPVPTDLRADPGVSGPHTHVQQIAKRRG